MHRRNLVSVSIPILLCSLMFGVAGAAAQGNSSIDEYTENVPTAGGDEPSEQHGGGGGNPGGGNDSSGDGLPAETVDELNQAGPDGQAIAAIPTQSPSSPGGSNSAGDHHGQGPSNGGDPSGESAHANSGDPAPAGRSDARGISKVVGQTLGGGDGGIGLALPIILVTTLVGALLFVAARRRRTTSVTSA